MARPGYFTFRVDDKTKEIFDRFTSQKGIAKSHAMEEMLTVFMLCTDEKLYTELLKEELDVERSKKMLLERLLRSNHNDPMIFRISEYNKKGITLSEREVVETYIKNLKTNGLGYTWLSTNALGKGIDAKKVFFYNQLSTLGEEVTLLIVFTSDNQIHYSAIVKEMMSSVSGIEKPDLGVPPEFKHEQNAKIWLKLTEIREEKNITTDQLRFRSNDAEVLPILKTSQFLFGYVYKKTL